MFAAHFEFWPFLLTIALLTLSPGADTLLVVRNTLRGGRVDGGLTTLAICSGLFVHATVSALGVAALIATSPAAYAVLQGVGALYLCWLGLGSLRASLGPYVTPNYQAAYQGVQVGRSLREGFLSNVLNPKTLTVYLAILPQFIDPAQAWVQSMVLAGLHFALSVVWLGLILWFVNLVKRHLLADSVRRWIDRAFGVSLMALGLMLAFQ